MPRPAASRVALWSLAILVGTGVFLVTCLTEPAVAHTFNFGTEYGQMAVAPFELVGKFPHRILGPLVAHMLGLAGERYWLFAHGCSIALLALIFAAAVRFGATLGGAAVLTTVIGFTGTVQIFKGHVGYPDPITFLLMVASLLCARRPVAFWLVMFSNVMNHEQVLFFWPWLLWWRQHHAAARWRDDLIGGVTVLAVYVVWRLVVGAHATQQLLTMEHYLGLQYFPVGTAGLAALNLLSTFIWFGLLPVLIAWHAFADGWRRTGAGIALFLVCQHAVFGVAHDVYRFTCFLFLPALFAGLRLLQRDRGLLGLTVIGGVSAVLVKLQAPVFVAIGTSVLVETTAGGPAVRSDPVRTIVPEVIPAHWPTFAAYGVALVATIAAGAWLGRRWPVDREPGAVL